MAHHLTLIAAHAPLPPEAAGAIPLCAGAPHIIDARAARWIIPAAPDQADILRWRAALAPFAVDIFITPENLRADAALFSDMDATIVAEETLDELAVAAGIGPQIAAITARAMRGEIAFDTALRQRVMMLRGQPLSFLHDALPLLTINDGAHELTAAFKSRGAATILVTGGFTIFAAHIAALCGFDTYHANILEIENGVLTGAVRDPLLDRGAKYDIMMQWCAENNCPPARVTAIGDGSNDLQMLQGAGLGIGYRPKPLLLENLPNCIIHGTLATALYALAPAHM